MVGTLVKLWLMKVVVSQLLNHVLLFLTPWIAACQASLSFTISRSLLKLMSIESVILSSHLILCHLLLLPSIFPASRSFPMSQLFSSGDQSIGASASASVLPVNFQGWFPLGWTLGLISSLFEGLPRVFSSTTVRKHQLFSAQQELHSGDCWGYTREWYLSITVFPKFKQWFYLSFF